MTGSTEDDFRDVFKLLYNDEDWASDDELDARTQPEVEQVEVELDPFQRHLERYSRKRFMADLDDLLRPSAKRQRVFNPSATSSSSSIPSTSPFPDLPSTSTYAPYSPLPLLSRLRTFHPSSYSTYIPSPLNASSAALYGWINDEKDSLWCGLCQARWSLGEVAGITEDKVRVEVAKRLKTGLVTKHKKGCAWRVRSCPETLHSKLRQTLHPPLVSSLSALAQHIDSECLPGPSTYRWTSPLTVSQATSLCARISRSPSDNDEQSSNRQSFAAALALFGWYPFHPNGPVHTLMPTSESSQSTDIVQCRICERRVGLWAFSKPSEETARVRTFDLIEEHLGWCPIRGGDKAWWADLPLLREKDKGLQTKDWIRVSTRLETKSWRKKHAVGLDT